MCNDPLYMVTKQKDMWIILPIRLTSLRQPETERKSEAANIHADRKSSHSFELVNIPSTTVPVTQKNYHAKSDQEDFHSHRNDHTVSVAMRLVTIYMHCPRIK